MAFKKTFIVNTDDVNCLGFRVLTSGLDLSAANKNCPAYYNHKTWEVPLGHWENIRIEAGKVLADIVIDGGNEIEKDYIRKIENGDIKAASIGADPIEWDSSPSVILAGQKFPTCTKSCLLEISLAPLPQNKNALALKYNGSLITLSSENANDFLPLLNKHSDMKAIALKLGLPETASENEILTAVGNIQLAKTNAETFNASVLQEAESGLTEEQKPIFIALSKADPAQALKFVQLSKSTAPVATATPNAATVVKKDLTVSQLIQLGKNAGGETVSNEDSFDYLQKHNRMELARIQKEEPAKYAELSKGYANGVRYKGK